ncbi:jerky protein homolog-like isoform X1 [Bactrocera tryoni]|uniref:jerky protein homolog-like isoform X1 n=1 Tax=Bactrocera tryoni TaxID=59916 RepID=UPI001A96F980|nr:jerky protein homolog-like isoform X1 [Bactrocera tryoni]
MNLTSTLVMDGFKDLKKGTVFDCCKYQAKNYLRCLSSWIHIRKNLWLKWPNWSCVTTSYIMLMSQAYSGNFYQKKRTCPVWKREPQVFKEWFHESFVPQVTSFLKEKGFPIKVLLLIDNAPSHPNEAQLTTEDGQILAMFMPPNVTPLIQPMDQNAIKITKLHYRNNLLASIAATNSNLLDTMKKITLRRAINLLDAAWSRVSEVTLANCWKYILNFTAGDDDPEDSVPLAVLNEKWGAGLRALMSNTADLLNSLNAEAELTLPGVHEWNEDIEDDDANDEHEEEDDSDEGSVSEVEEKIKRTEAVEIFNKAIMM